MPGTSTEMAERRRPDADEDGFLLAGLDDEEDEEAGPLVYGSSPSPPSRSPASTPSSAAAGGRSGLFRVAACAVAVLVAVVVVAVATARGGGSGGAGGAAPGAAAGDGGEWDEAFLAMPTAAGVQETLWNFTRYTTMAGTEGGAKAARLMAETLRAAGLPEVREYDYEVLLNRPGERVVEVVEPEKARYTALLKEDPIKEDGTSAGPDIVPTFNAYGAAGDVRGPLVYCNYGRPEDYEALLERGVNLTGSVVLVRYGKNFRGLKAMAAERHGAAAVLIYSDPANFGAPDADHRAYPLGPWRPARGAQRGSAQYLSQFAGDPLTPGVAAVSGANATFSYDGENSTLPRSPSLPGVPVQPLSWDDARHLLAHLDGLEAAEVGGDEWVEGVANATGGAAPRVGAAGAAGGAFQPVTAHVRMTPVFNRSRITNVCGRINGTREGGLDTQVVIGNHRDAWVYGAVDPHSGTAAFVELAKAFGEMLRQGWKPRRTVTMCSWDAEEYGLLGSTEWAEQFRHELTSSRPAVAYLNVDVAVEGALNAAMRASASPSLGPAIRRAAGQVVNPATNRTLLHGWTASQGEPEGQARVAPLGSGSDFTPFLQHLGVAAADLRIEGTNYGGVYHSIYDSYDWIARYGDESGWAHHLSVARLWGLVTLRLANAAVLPLDLEETGRSLVEMSAHMLRVAREGNATAALQGRLLDLLDASAEYASAGSFLNVEAAAASTDRERASVNHRLASAERGFVSDRKLPYREVAWYRHKVYAPALFGGYNAAVLPSISEPAARGDWATAEAEAEHLVSLVRHAALALQSPGD